MSQLTVGDVLEGRYRIDHPIARGGMSTVYRCVDLRLGRAVAAKVMHDEYADDPASRVRFRREARAMAQMSHPNLVGVYDFSSDDGMSYLVMELITGGTLRELLAERGPMPPHAATAVMRAVLTGLSVAHQQGMVHRDIKPDNILINADHRVKVADFGLVRAAAASSHSTGSIVGTAAYLSPEQVSGSETTPATDVYSAGVVLFELLTGETPFSGDTPLAHAIQRLERDVPAPSSRIDGIPPLFDELVATSTARDPEQRFHDAGEFLAALDDVAAELQLPAFTVPVPTNSAAHRAAAVPTDTTGVIETTTLSPEPEETKIVEPEDEAPAQDTRFLPPAAAAGATAAGSTPATQHLPSEPEEIPADQPDPVSNRSGWKLGIGLVIAAVLIGAVVVGAWWFGSGRYGEIPQIVGMDRATAIETVQEAGFEVDSEIVYDDDVAADNAVGTQPEPGERLEPGSLVTVLISRGPPTVPAPADGMSLEDYRALAGERTLEVDTGDSVFSDDVPTGAVAETTPAAGEAVPVGSTVTAHLSLGPEPIEVPDLAGMDADDARTTLEELGLNIGETTSRFDDEIPGGAIITTEPGPGRTLERGERVDLVISTAVAIPDLTGQLLDDAEDRLSEEDFDVDDKRDDNAVGSHEDEVVAMRPVPGTLVDPDVDTEVLLITPGQITVPDVTGRTVRDARSQLRDAGLGIDASIFDNSDTITRQTPAAGTALERGERVEVETDG
ncbi:Stk1 family PASTA domain-containing Ser/Thr kinase [Corynebacterium yudongzhengii]|uniref:non-specific serine/threonine protein kinase n=1 Tax=Corynebacterium yudongzhengii TaxID=2080740 RepID=A0A2U1T7B4_9CORY|nr:Stk1 family PASTA domain-containing Ser/Thr kinase [Corynebacterium yudongzhengii]AWB81556.1 Stk1 family PASTA domain-containing Ser/Thr kinase [Corynebacterium yudongzhengii]PWC01873.1 Stk1 family PASTA domain-containing Ser/Thr kinase [Corynebacterium yudongzhengii]